VAESAESRRGIWHYVHLSDELVVLAAPVQTVIARPVERYRRRDDRVGSAQDPAPVLGNVDSDTSCLYRISTNYIRKEDNK